MAGGTDRPSGGSRLYLPVARTVMPMVWPSSWQMVQPTELCCRHRFINCMPFFAEPFFDFARTHFQVTLIGQCRLAGSAAPASAAASAGSTILYFFLVISSRVAVPFFGAPRTSSPRWVRGAFAGTWAVHLAF